MIKNKPLNACEQSMLLSAMLFDSKNIDDILKFFPDEHYERLMLAKQKLLNTSNPDRLTQIILELRRLLLIENNIYHIHQSWIDDLMTNEPKYLRNIITDILLRPLSKTNIQLFPVSLGYILWIFMSQLSKTPQKTAIFDPVLMRLQSLKNQKQENIFFDLGNLAISALLLVAKSNRLKKYLYKKNIKVSIDNKNIYNNPFEVYILRQNLLKEIVRFSYDLTKIPGQAFIGLVVVAMYLSAFKYQWRQSIILVLEKKFGYILEKIIERLKSVHIDSQYHNILSNFILLSLDSHR